MKLKILVAVSALLASGVSVASPYQYDIGADLSRTDKDGQSKTNKFEVFGSYYFDSVNTANVPLAEAAYLGKNSNAHASAARSSGGDDVNEFSLGAEFYIPENFLYIDAGVTRETENSNDDNDWYTTLGVTPIDGLRVSTTYAHDEGYDANIHAKYVTSLGAGEFINVEAAFYDHDDSSSKLVAADYYFDTTLSIGGQIENRYSDNSYTLRGRKFFTQDVSGELSYTDRADGNVISVGANIRF